MDGPLHGGLHPHGRRGRQLDRRGAVLDPRACVPKSRRRHLQSLRLARHPFRGGDEHPHHLQDFVQRRRGDDRRPKARGRSQRRNDRPSGRRRGRSKNRAGHRRAAQIRRDHRLAARPRNPPSQRAQRGAARSRANRGRHGADLRSDLRRRKAPPAQARPISRSRRARHHQRAGLRGLRRLRHRVELRRRAAAGDRIRAQAPHRPIGVQQGFFLPRGLLPELRHRAWRAHENGAAAEREGRGGAARSARARGSPKSARRPTACWSRDWAARGS